MLRVIIICGIVIISFIYFINKLLFEIRRLENKVKETNNNQKETKESEKQGAVPKCPCHVQMKCALASAIMHPSAFCLS